MESTSRLKRFWYVRAVAAVRNVRYGINQPLRVLTDNVALKDFTIHAQFFLVNRARMRSIFGSELACSQGREIVNCIGNGNEGLSVVRRPRSLKQPSLHVSNKNDTASQLRHPKLRCREDHKIYAIAQFSEGFGDLLLEAHIFEP